MPQDQSDRDQAQPTTDSPPPDDLFDSSATNAPPQIPGRQAGSPIRISSDSSSEDVPLITQWRQWRFRRGANGATGQTIDATSQRERSTDAAEIQQTQRNQQPNSSTARQYAGQASSRPTEHSRWRFDQPPPDQPNAHPSHEHPAQFTSPSYTKAVPWSAAERHVLYILRRFFRFSSHDSSRLLNTVTGSNRSGFELASYYVNHALGDGSAEWRYIRRFNTTAEGQFQRGQIIRRLVDLVRDMDLRGSHENWQELQQSDQVANRRREHDREQLFGQQDNQQTNQPGQRLEQPLEQQGNERSSQRRDEQADPRFTPQATHRHGKSRSYRPRKAYVRRKEEAWTDFHMFFLNVLTKDRKRTWIRMSKLFNEFFGTRRTASSLCSFEHNRFRSKRSTENWTSMLNYANTPQGQAAQEEVLAWVRDIAPQLLQEPTSTPRDDVAPVIHDNITVASRPSNQRPHKEVHGESEQSHQQHGSQRDNDQDEPQDSQKGNERKDGQDKLRDDGREGEQEDSRTTSNLLN